MVEGMQSSIKLFVLGLFVFIFAQAQTHFYYPNLSTSLEPSFASPEFSDFFADVLPINNKVFKEQIRQNPAPSIILVFVNPEATPFEKEFFTQIKHTFSSYAPHPFYLLI